MIGLARAILRLLVYPWLALVCIVDYFSSGAAASIRGRVDWLQRTARRHAKWIGLRIRVSGQIPKSGLVVSNHVSYLDIVGLSAAGAFAFVSKKEVGDWPIFGEFARKGATIFVDREHRGAVADVADQMRVPLVAGVPIVLFPEGTSTSGDRMLPFRSSLFDPVVKLDCPLTPCGLHYSVEEGNVAEEVAYWGDMDLVPHMLKLLGKRGILMEIRFGKSEPRSSDRKVLARQMHAEVAALAGLSTPLQGS